MTMIDRQIESVVILTKDEYDRLIAAATEIPVMESLHKFRAADATWGLQSIERVGRVGEWDQVVITGSRPWRGFKNYGGDWDETP